VELQRVSRVARLTLFLTYYSLLTQVLDLTERILTKFGFMKYEIMLSTRPEKAVGSDEIWEQACMYAHAVRI
jgi:threonyl-tRNA synthetase